MKRKSIHDSGAGRYDEQRTKVEVESSYAYWCCSQKAFPDTQRLEAVRLDMAVRNACLDLQVLKISSGVLFPT